ncbi:hypothetical protein GOBAR_DD16137 [Gossypium barbadense]|nr:hypothetical protein GOBAR_DD16137 [Gossypium barbadense]
MSSSSLPKEGNRGKMKMEGIEGDATVGGAGRYILNPTRINSEDIIFCVDVDAESLVEMKTAGVTRLDSIKQAMLLFVNSKLSINPDHRFAFATLSKTASWFSSDVESTIGAVRALSATTVSTGQADLTNLFRLAAHEAKKSRAQNRILRVGKRFKLSSPFILIYCRSSIRPHHQWPVNQKLFTLDVMYLHDKPGPDNCPQAVYDALVDALEHVSEYEGYIHESGHGLPRTLFRFMSMLLSHPQQRCPQDDCDIPKPLMKKSAESANGEDNNVHVSTSRQAYQTRHAKSVPDTETLDPSQHFVTPCSDINHIPHERCIFKLLYPIDLIHTKSMDGDDGVFHDSTMLY